MRLRDGLSLAVVVAGAALARAHQPTLSDGTAVSPESAIQFENVQISRVVYHEITAAAPQLWLTFSIDEPQNLLLQVGVPRIDRLADLRPALAVLGPGLPEPDATLRAFLPFEVPAGLGVALYDSSGVTDPERFDEPFSGTLAWILVDVEPELPAAGQYYVVAWVPQPGQPGSAAAEGKLWVALGKLEVFGPEDIAALPEEIEAVRAFHETATAPLLPCFAPLVGMALAAVGLVRLGRRARGQR